MNAHAAPTMSRRRSTAPAQPTLPIPVPAAKPKRQRRVNAVVSIPVREGVKPMTYRPAAELHTELLLHSMASGKSMQKIIDAALVEYFARLREKGG